MLEKIHEEGMIPGERGIMNKKGIYFHSPSVFAKEHLFCVYWGAEYLCVPPYQVCRSGLHSYLFFCILSGELRFTYREQTFMASTGDIVLFRLYVSPLLLHAKAGQGSSSFTLTAISP